MKIVFIKKVKTKNVLFCSADFIMITSLLELIKKATACQQPLFYQKTQLT